MVGEGRGLRRINSNILLRWFTKLMILTSAQWQWSMNCIAKISWSQITLNYYWWELLFLWEGGRGWGVGYKLLVNGLPMGGESTDHAFQLTEENLIGMNHLRFSSNVHYRWVLLVSLEPWGYRLTDNTSSNVKVWSIVWNVCVVNWIIAFTGWLVNNGDGIIHHLMHTNCHGQLHIQ